MKIVHPHDEDHPVFVTTTCLDKAPYFRKGEWAELAIEQIDRLRGLGVWLVSEYVIMPDHVHILTKPMKPLGYGMQEFKKSVARLMNRKEKVKGRKIWLDEYHARVILGELEYSRKVEYIHWNPVKARLVAEPQDYLYSSATPVRSTDRHLFY